MRMKMFAAETFDAARALVFAEMGDEAVILSEREVDGRVEVRAATDGASRRGGPDRPLFLRGNDRASDTPTSVLSHRIRDALTWHGAPRRFADRVAHAADPDIQEPAEALASGLEDLLLFDPLSTQPRQNILLVGPPGHGRTSTAAKLTRRAAVAKTEILPVAADFDATAGGEQLSAYLERERAQVRIATDPDALFGLMDEVHRREERCVIDLPAIVPFDHEDLARLKDLVAAIDVEPVLVLSAEGHPDDQAEAARAFASAGVKRAILTKLDVARRRGGAIAALSAAKIALSHLAITPFIGGGLIPAAPSRLGALLMEDAVGQDALRGAA
ncbi:MAG: flagellar biosynthesis protein FlhF-like protein [Pseudomonadota bacterium]